MGSVMAQMKPQIVGPIHDIPVIANHLGRVDPFNGHIWLTFTLDRPVIPSESEIGMERAVAVQVVLPTHALDEAIRMLQAAREGRAEVASIYTGGERPNH